LFFTMGLNEVEFVFVAKEDEEAVEVVVVEG
jgi:hypothetical protein